MLSTADLKRRASDLNKEIEKTKSKVFPNVEPSSRIKNYFTVVKSFGALAKYKHWKEFKNDPTLFTKATALLERMRKRRSLVKKTKLNFLSFVARYGLASEIEALFKKVDEEVGEVIKMISLAIRQKKRKIGAVTYPKNRPTLDGLSYPWKDFIPRIVKKNPDTKRSASTSPRRSPKEVRPPARRHRSFSPRAVHKSTVLTFFPFEDKKKEKILLRRPKSFPKVAKIKNATYPRQNGQRQRRTAAYRDAMGIIKRGKEMSQETMCDLILYAIGNVNLRQQRFAINTIEVFGEDPFPTLQRILINPSRDMLIRFMKLFTRGGNENDIEKMMECSSLFEIEEEEEEEEEDPESKKKAESIEHPLLKGWSFLLLNANVEEDLKKFKNFLEVKTKGDLYMDTENCYLEIAKNIVGRTVRLNNKKREVYETIGLIQLADPESRKVCLLRVHECGDEKLKEVAKLLEGVVKPRSIIGYADSIVLDVKIRDIQTVWEKKPYVQGDTVALADCAKVLLGEEIGKGEQMSDWSRPTLRKAQMDYAALDAILVWHLHQTLYP